MLLIQGGEYHGYTLFYLGHRYYSGFVRPEEHQIGQLRDHLPVAAGVTVQGRLRWRAGVHNMDNAVPVN
jgi:hypothetical protein